MPISNEDISKAAKALQDARGWEAPLAFRQVVSVTQHSLMCIREALRDQINGDATYESAHEFVLEWLPTMYHESWRGRDAVDLDTAMAVHESLKVALIECTIEEAKTRAERLLPLMKVQPTQQELAHVQGAP